jgi:oxygen-independent coproporphyrinogen-3 oxidase
MTPAREAMPAEIWYVTQRVLTELSTIGGTARIAASAQSIMATSTNARPTAAHKFAAPVQQDDAFGVYIHIPFCTHICPYCDFNTFAGQADRIPRYVEAVRRETTLWSASFAGRTAESVFLGGGTPSLLTPEQIQSVLAACQDAFALAPGAEITIEANPNDLDEAYCTRLLAAGVHRLSIGAQTLDRRGLRVLGRLHEAEQTASAVAAARSAGFTNISLDFIYGWPGQTLPGWRDELARVLAGAVGGSRPDHLSLYGLIVEPGTPMSDAVKRHILTPVDDDAAADLYEAAIDLLAAAGWYHYEIANWAAVPEMASRHNAVYWRNGDYAGIGAGAHGHVAGRRTMNQPSPARYIAMVDAGRSPVTNTETIDARTAMGETMMLGLRLLHDGVSAAAFAQRHGIALPDQFGAEISRLVGLGLLDADERRVTLTRRGALLANSVCAEFLAP